MGLNQVNSQVPVEKSINKVLLEGKIYYVHVVKPGQTLYSISRTYEISESEIISENPGVDKSMPAGLVLKIPATPATSSNIPPPERKIDNQSFIQHIIKQGETLYSLSKKYSTTVEEIERINQGINYKDLTIGQIIYIPNSQFVVDQQEYIYHKVKRKETIYGISKYYKITEEQLKTFNPELREAFPKRGQILKIPKVKETIITKTEVTKPTDFIDTIVQKPPVVDSSINILYDYYMDSLSEISGRPINVAYLIPFNYSITLEPEIEDSLNNIEPDEKDREKEPVYEEVLPENINLLEFMEGSLLAIDELRQKGISVNVTIFDTKKSTDRVKEILNSENFDKTDLIIGPFYSFNVEIVSEYSRQQHIPVISPFYNGSDFTEKNPYLFQANPSLLTQYDQIAGLLGNYTDENIIFIHSTDSLENKKFNYLKTQILNNLEFKGNMVNNEFMEIIYDNVNKPDFLKEITNILSKDKENLVVIPETDEVFVKAIVTHLFFQLKKFKIKIVGMPEWMTFQFQPEDYSYLHKLELSFFTPYYYSFDSTDIKHFLKEFTREFFSEPFSLTNLERPFGFIGYDLSHYFLSSLNKYGRRFILNLQDSQGGQLLNDFRFEKVSNSGGFENRSLMLIKLMPDMSVSAHKVGIPFMIKNQVSRENSLKE